MIISTIVNDTITLSAYQFVIMLIIGLICIGLSLFLLFKPRFPAAVASYIGAVILHLSTYIYLTNSALAFWGCTTIIVGILHTLLPKGEPANSRISNLYIGLAGIAGMAVGLAVHPSVMVLGIIIGTILGLFAYIRTPRGAWLKFPTFTFIQYFCAKGLPAIVALSIIGIVLEGFLVK